ncbi:MAG: ribonuclease HII [Thermodesulfobacteriota bacterium]
MPQLSTRGTINRSRRTSYGLLPHRWFEEEAAERGAQRIAGLDEAGRGPLAGPVVAAAVLFSRTTTPPQGLRDSKLMSPAVREKICARILETASGYGIGMVEPEVIDRINILQATRMAMGMACDQVTPRPDFLLIDGPIRLDVAIPQLSIIKGDLYCASVSAAGILAKVTRDRIMMELHLQYPMYGFDQHKGYPTEGHREALRKHGPSPVHRLCFKGVKDPA